MENRPRAAAACLSFREKRLVPLGLGLESLPQRQLLLAFGNVVVVDADALLAFLRPPQDVENCCCSPTDGSRVRFRFSVFFFFIFKKIKISKIYDRFGKFQKYIPVALWGRQDLNVIFFL